MALLGIGYRSVSMSPASVGPVKAMLLALDVDKLSAMLHATLDDTKDQTPVREMLTAFAAENGVPVQRKKPLIRPVGHLLPVFGRGEGICGKLPLVFCLLCDIG